jgi:hypothetical protein
MTPKNTRFQNTQRYGNIEQKLKKIPFNKYALKSGFKQRKNKKVTGKTLLVAFILMAMQGKNSFQHWAEEIGTLKGIKVSKQGIWSRMTDKLTSFLILILKDLMQKQLVYAPLHSFNVKWQTKYNRILIQDSTVIALPSWLSNHFPGNVSKGKKNAQLKIQVVYDIKANQFVHFEITPYTTNDQSKSKDILNIANPGDLVLRDLGYFTLESFHTMYSEQISFLSRLRYGVTIYSPKTGKEIDILNHLKKKGKFDAWVLIGKEKKVLVRLVAQKLTQAQADSRVRKAKNNRDKRLNHSKYYYQLLQYNLFITTEEEKTFSIDQIAQLYQLRWRIETIFKCWKSHFHLQKIIPQKCSLTKERVESTMYMMLIFILLFPVTIYNTVIAIAEKTTDYIISLTKLCKYIACHIDLFFDKELKKLIPLILYHCSYDRRRDRLNFIQKLNLG